MQRPRRLATAIVVLALAATTACEPSPPPPTFEVDSFLAGTDVDPGDGECLTATGSCTIQAAVQEANALGRGIVLVPGSKSTDYAGFDANITGNVTIQAFWDGSGDKAMISTSTFNVASGAGLVLNSIDLDGTVIVDGGLAASRVAIRSVEVSATGAAILSNAILLPDDQPALVNEGRALLTYTTVALSFGAVGLVTFGEGVTTIGATAVFGFDGSFTTTCYGTPVSLGYNAVTDTDCALTGPGDLEGVAVPSEFGVVPTAGSPLIDAVPVETLGCGTTVTNDARGVFGPRPVDGDGDGTAACDIGAYEVSHIPG